MVAQDVFALARPLVGCRDTVTKRACNRRASDNRGMQSLRNATFLARLVLAWFALSIGVAIASPVVKPQAIQLICSGGVVKIMSQGDDGDAPSKAHTLDCPLCAATGAPVRAAEGLVAAQRHVSHVLQSIPAARIAALTAAPLPARGPPAPAAL